MFQQMYEKLKPFRFRLTIIGLLSMASLISVALFRVRTLFSGTEDYAFLIWNLFLAWLPLVMAYIASSFASKRRFVALTLPFAANNIARRHFFRRPGRVSRRSVCGRTCFQWPDL